MKKLLLVALGGFVLLAGAGVVYLHFNLDGIVKHAIEHEGTALTQTKVSVASVHISPLSGKGTLTGLKIGNPPGYKEKNAFEADAVGLSLSLRSLLRPVVVIRSVVISGPRLDLETGKGGTNLERLQKNIAATGPAHPKGKTTASKSPSKKVIIGRFELADAKLRVEAGGVKAMTRTVTLNKVELKQVGGKEGGVAPAKAAGRIADGIMKEAVAESTKSMGGAVKGLIKGVDVLEPMPGSL